MWFFKVVAVLGLIILPLVSAESIVTFGDREEGDVNLGSGQETVLFNANGMANVIFPKNATIHIPPKTKITNIILNFPSTVPTNYQVTSGGLGFDHVAVTAWSSAKEIVVNYEIYGFSSAIRASSCGFLLFFTILAYFVHYGIRSD